MLILHIKYGPARLEAACSRASQGSRINYAMVRNILGRRLDRQLLYLWLQLLPITTISGVTINIYNYQKTIRKMNTTQTLHQMQQLRLSGMHHAYRSQLEPSMDQQLEGHDLVADLLESEELNGADEKTAFT